MSKIKKVKRTPPLNPALAQSLNAAEIANHAEWVKHASDTGVAAVACLKAAERMFRELNRNKALAEGKKLAAIQAAAKCKAAMDGLTFKRLDDLIKDSDGDILGNALADMATWLGKIDPQDAADLVETNINHIKKCLYG